MAHPFFNVYSIIKDVPSFWIMQAFFMPFLVFSFYAQKHYAWLLIFELTLWTEKTIILFG